MRWDGRGRGEVETLRRDAAAAAALAAGKAHQIASEATQATRTRPRCGEKWPAAKGSTTFSLSEWTIPVLVTTICARGGA